MRKSLACGLEAKALIVLTGQQAIRKHDRRSVSTSLYVLTGTGHWCVTDNPLS
jgi:hypothetical protein